MCFSNLHFCCRNLFAFLQANSSLLICNHLAAAVFTINFTIPQFLLICHSVVVVVLDFNPICFMLISQMITAKCDKKETESRVQ